MERRPVRSWPGDDVRAILAIFFGAVVSWSSTAMILREPADHAVVRLEIRGPLLELRADGKQTVGVPVAQGMAIPARVPPGSRVDVLAVGASHAGEHVVARVVAREVEVLNSYLRFSPEVEAEIVVVSVTTTRKEGQRINRARTRGELRLVRSREW